MSPKLKALLATGRISNLPTVWCNCLAAVLLVIQSGFIAHKDISIGLIIMASCAYVGGCFLGDVFDVEFDRKHKPDRPIPSGILDQKLVLWLGLFLVLVPAYFIKSSSYLYLLLFGAIMLYALLHKRIPLLGLPLIGLCRFFLITFAAGTITEVPIILYASAVAIYTIAFASVARTESSDSPITWRTLLRYTMLALPLTVLFTNQSFQLETITALIIYALWITYAFSFLNTNKGNYVSKCLAGFCLLDACFVAQFGWIWLIICLILFVFALGLQKIAPAT